MFSPFLLDKLARLENAQRLKKAAQSRAVHMARGDSQRPATAWRTIALSLAVVAVGLVLLTSMIW